MAQCGCSSRGNTAWHSRAAHCCDVQARENYPITVIHAEGEPSILTSSQPMPLKHQDVISIADACFLFERVGMDVT